MRNYLSKDGAIFDQGAPLDFGNFFSKGIFELHLGFELNKIKFSPPKQNLWSLKLNNSPKTLARLAKQHQNI